MILITVRGVVQGVGFRPAVYRIAREMGLAGSVENALDGVHIRLHASQEQSRLLVERVRRMLPPAARIDSVTFDTLADDPASACSPFRIVRSRDDLSRITDISPDIAICPECMADIARQPRRKNYPLTNCTHCGPRFSIVNALPYDRCNTSMSRFAMCGECRSEYEDPLDRRFHAQPVSCNRCGPVYTGQFGNTAITDYRSIVERAAEVIASGGILMCKSLGGYNLMADATQTEAVRRLRDLKHRPRKPFAVMVTDVETASRLVTLNAPEREALTSWRAPIVVAQMSNHPTSSARLLSPDVAPGYTTLGVMLPYMAFQHHLTAAVGRPLTVTSANRPGCPILTDDKEAHLYANEAGVPIVSYNRDIVNFTDDSVVRYSGGEMRILRRSRGYVPTPLPTGDECDGIVALGADITSSWAFGRERDIIQSQYIGSLSGEGGEKALRKSIETLLAIYRCEPSFVVTDRHPAYRSAAIGREMAVRLGIPLVKVWHHHAHAASVMAEYGISGPVLALILDGTGYGTDGTIWGSELLECTFTDFTRLAHGPALPMPGGDAAATEPWRMAVAFVKRFTGDTAAVPAHIMNEVGREKVGILCRMIDRGINCPLSYGAGRMWDAVAALLGLALFNGYDSEAPILLENLALSYDPADDHHASIPSPLATAEDFDSLAHRLLTMIGGKYQKSRIALDFHRGYASCWAATVRRHIRHGSPTTIVLSGGVMNNSLLCELLRHHFEEAGLTVLIPRNTPCGDGGIAAGQIAIASHIINRPGTNHFKSSDTNRHA